MLRDTEVFGTFGEGVIGKISDMLPKDIVINAAGALGAWLVIGKRVFSCQPVIDRPS